MDKVKVLWSGITGRTGKTALNAVEYLKNVEIVAGISRDNPKYYNYENLSYIKEEFDVIVDFSHKDSFDIVLDYALKVNKPLVSGTSGLSDEQLLRLEEASKTIPIFRGGNFRFDVEKFINDVVEYSKSHDNLKLIETHYKTKHVPSETSKVIQKRVFSETSKNVEIESYCIYDELINDYKLDNLHCRVGFDKLGEDVLKIAFIMKDKPAGLYNLNMLIR